MRYSYEVMNTVLHQLCINKA